MYTKAVLNLRLTCKRYFLKMIEFDDYFEFVFSDPDIGYHHWWYSDVHT